MTPEEAIERTLAALEDLPSLIQAAAWDEGMQAGMDFQVKLGRFLEYDGPEPEPPTNPYRSQT